MKNKTIEAISTREQADALLSEYAQLERQIGRIVDTAEQRQRAIREHASEEAAPLMQRRDLIEKSLSSWFKKEERSLGARSLKLAAGTLAMHSKPVVKLLAGWNWDRTLARLQDGGKRWADFLRTKVEINKQAFLDDTSVHGEPMASVGLKIGKSETFRIDLDAADTRERASSRAGERAA